MSEQEGKGKTSLQVLDSKTSGTGDDEVISVVDWDGVMEESLSNDEYVKLVVNLNPVTQEQASGLMAALKGFGVPLNEDEQAEAVKRYGDWWKDEKGEI